MNFLKEAVLNQLIRIPAVKERAKRSHQTGISHNPEMLMRQYELLTKCTNVEGNDILELGPGMTNGVVLKAKENGAASVAIADIERYLSKEETEDQGIDYKIYDGRRIPFDDASFDLIWSSDVYEHVRFPQLTVEETYRLLRPGGMVVHLIDLKDHFSYTSSDPDMVFNCLRYSKWQWEAMTWNRSNFVNRLRASEWIKLHESLGFEIVNSDTLTSDHVVKNLPLEGKLDYLKGFSESDAVTTEIHLTAKKK